jgi:RNA polymerase sigma-70 factor (ECF subfamily)
MDQATSLAETPSGHVPVAPNLGGGDDVGESFAGGSEEVAASLPAPTFADVYRDGVSFVWRNVRRLGVAEESVRDAVQDVFLVVHRRLESYEGRSSVRTWLFGIAMHVARDYRRAARRKALRSAPPPPFGSSPDPFEHAVAAGPGPDKQVEAVEANRLLLCLLDELDEERRAVFVLTELEQMSAPEVSAALGLNLNTVHGRLRAARLQFEQALRRHRAREQHLLRRVT